MLTLDSLPPRAGEQDERKPAMMQLDPPDGWFLKSPLELPPPPMPQPEPELERSVTALPKRLVVVEEYGGLRLSMKKQP